MPDFLDVPVASSSLDAAIILHTIYHIHVSRQTATVRKLINVVKPSYDVVVVYSGPDESGSSLMRPLRRYSANRA